MCLITISYKQHPSYPLILVQNRDESYTRESEPVYVWEDHPEIVAGRDTLHGGTWSGITKSGRLASLTNRPFEQFSAAGQPFSRGKLVKDFLAGHDDPETFLHYLRKNRLNYDNYQLLFGTVDDLRVYSNAADSHRVLKPGLHSLSNTNDDLSVHKVRRSLNLVGEYLKTHSVPDLNQLISLYRDTRQADILLNVPEQVPIDLALKHSAIFIKGETFGTVNTTALTIHNDKTVRIKENRFDQEKLIEQTDLTFQLVTTA